MGRLVGYKAIIFATLAHFCFEKVTRQKIPKKSEQKSKIKVNDMRVNSNK